MTIQHLGRVDVANTDSVQRDSQATSTHAHTWWSYVWHEMRKFHHSSDSDGTLIGAEHLTRAEEDTDQSLVEKLRNIINSQAIEITSLRQVFFKSFPCVLLILMYYYVLL
jgi:hypothetical protein